MLIRTVAEPFHDVYLISLSSIADCMCSFPLVETVTLLWNVLVLFSRWSFIVNVEQFVFVLNKSRIFLLASCVG